MTGFILPGFPGGPPMPPRRRPSGRGLYLARTMAERLEAGARQSSPISQYLRAQAALQWGLPAHERRNDEAPGA